MSEKLSYAMDTHLYEKLESYSEDLRHNKEYDTLLIGFKPNSIHCMSYIADIMYDNWYCNVRTFSRKNGLFYFVYEYGHCVEYHYRM